MVLAAQPKRTIPIHHKKRHGQHQRQTKRFKDTYWPYLPMALIVAVGIVASTVWSNRQHQVLGAHSNLNASQLLSVTNKQRDANREGPLQSDLELNEAAQAKANDMVAHNYWSHNSPSGATPWTFMTDAGYKFQSAGENLAYGFSSSNDVVAGWMNSAEHRANILDADYTQVGFGVAHAANFQGHGSETVVVAIYGEPASASTAPQVLGAQTGPSEHIARIQLLTGGIAPWSIIAVAGIAALCALAITIRHGLAWRRVLVKSEAFVVKHPFLDILVVSMAVMGVLLSRVGGVIL
jgi:uncharacterized protein YkwD